MSDLLESTVAELLNMQLQANSECDAASKLGDRAKEAECWKMFVSCVDARRCLQEVIKQKECMNENRNILRNKCCP